MKRRAFISLLASTAIEWPCASRAQQKSLPVIGFLSIGSAGPFAANVAALKQGLSATGYVERRNVVFEYRWAEGHYDQLPALVADLVDRKVDVIATSGGSQVARAAKNATSTIPIVFIGGDPVAEGLVVSLARPSGNLTGVVVFGAELMPKRVELLADLIPQIRVIALLVNSAGTSAERIVQDVLETARAKGLQIHILKASTEGEIETTFTSLVQLHAGALIVSNDPFFFSRRAQLVALAAHYAVPAIYELSEFATIGGLISYGTSLTGMYHRAGAYLGRILAGTKPADLPIQQPTTFELVVNLKTAKALGLTVPQSFLIRADTVIE